MRHTNAAPRIIRPTPGVTKQVYLGSISGECYRDFSPITPPLYNPAMRFTDERELGGARYRAYLASVSERLPTRLKAFAVQDWYYDPNDHRCPHDSWLEQLTIDEPASGERSEQRSIAIRLRLLAPYHDGEILFAHRNVRQYRLETPAEYKWPPYGVGHGDFLRDEIRLLEDGFIEHNITFSRGSRFIIECSDIEFEFRSKS